MLLGTQTISECAEKIYTARMNERVCEWVERKQRVFRGGVGDETVVIALCRAQYQSIIFFLPCVRLCPEERESIVA